jgi:hypothetical protein
MRGKQLPARTYLVDLASGTAALAAYRDVAAR